MNMNTGSDSNNINYNSNKKENINSSSISTGKQFVKDSIEQYNNTSSYGSTPEIETMDLSFATEQLEENKNTLTSRLKSFFNSLLGKEDETSSSVTSDVQSRVDVSMNDNNYDVETLDENVMPEFDSEVFHPFRGNDNFYNGDNSEGSTSSIFVGNSSYSDDNSSEVFHPFRGNDNFYNNGDAESSMFVGDTTYSNDNSSEVDYSAFVENCQAMIDSMDAEIAAKEKEFYEKYGDNTSSAVDFRVTYEDEFNSTQQAIQNMLDQLEDMLPIEYINEYCLEAYGGEGITYDALVSLYNAALNGDQEAHNRFTEIMRGGFSKLQDVDSSYTDESVNYLMESEVNGLFENIVDKITYINNLVAPAVQMAQEIRALKDARNQMFMYSHAYILELPEVKEYTTEELLQYFTEEELALLGEGKDEARIYAYLMKNGLLDDADEYMNGLRGILNQLQGMQWAREWAEEIVEDDGDLLSDLWHNNLSGTWGGIVNFGYGFYNMFSNILDPNKPMSAEAWKQTFIMTMLSDVETVENEDGTITEKASIIEELYGKDSLEYELYMKIQDLDYRWLLSFDYQLSLSGGNMLPTMLVSTGLSFIPGVGPTLARKVGAGMMFVSTMGNAVDSAYQRDISGFEAYLYGALMAYSEMSLEKVLGGIPYLSDASGFTLRSFLGEGFEEGLQTYVEFFADAAFFNEPIDLESFLGTSGDSAAAFGMGVVMSIFTNGGQVPINIGANAVKVITTDDVLKFYKTDMNGESYFDAFAFGEYLLGMNSLNNNNQRAAMEHFIDSGTVGVVNNDVLYEALMDLDSSALFEILTTCDDETRAVLLANMNEVDLKDIIVSSTKYLDAQYLLDEHRAIQESLKKTAQEQSVQTDSSVVIDGKNKSNVLYGLFFKLLNLPLSDEVKLKLIEKMSDEDKAKALSYLKSEDRKYKVVQSMEDLAIRYNSFYKNLNDSEYVEDFIDAFLEDFNDTFFNFSDSNFGELNFIDNVNLTNFLSSLDNEQYIYDIFDAINNEPMLFKNVLIGKIINCLTNPVAKYNCLVKYYQKCSIDMVCDILSQLKDDKQLLFDLLNGFVQINFVLGKYKYNLDYLNKLIENSSDFDLIKYISDFIDLFFINSTSLTDFDKIKSSNFVFAFYKSNPEFIDDIKVDYVKYLLKFLINSDSKVFSFFSNLLESNPFILERINFGILSSDIISGLGFDRVKEMFMYPDIQQKVLNIYNTDKEKFSLFCEVINSINYYSQNVLFQPYINKLFDVFLSSEFNNVLCIIGNNFNDLKKPKEIINLILSMSTNKEDFDKLSYTLVEGNFPKNSNEILESCFKNISSVDDLNNLSCVYYEKLNSEYQILYNKQNKSQKDIIKIKDLFLIDFFGISYEEANKLVSQYKYLDIVGFLDEDSLFIYKILSDVCKLADINYFSEYLMDTATKDVFKFYGSAYILEQSIKNAYSQHYMDKTYKIENNTPSEYRKVSIKDKNGNILSYQIPIYELDDDSILLVHKKDAYGTGNNLSDSFVDQYNIPPSVKIAERHHLSVSAISKSQGGIAQSEKFGLIYGYSKWDVESFFTMSNGDMSSFSKYVIGSSLGNLNEFMATDILLDSTKLYNEIVFDRNGIKPSYMVITSDMLEDLIQRTYQAAYDWGIPIVYR